jgi:hypothetical protein
MVTEPYAHGTVSRYQAKKCRCDDCRAAQKHYMDNWRREHGQNVGPFRLSCLTCGAAFVAGTRMAKYCSFGCRPKPTNTAKQSKCRRCRTSHPVAEDAGRIRTGLCARCQALVAGEIGSCGLCGIRWWQGDGITFCSEECRNLAAVRQAIIEEDYL